MFKHLVNSNEEVGRPDCVFSYIDLLIKDEQYKEVIMFLQEEEKFMKRVNPTSTKRTTYAVDCVLLGILLGDHVMAERSMENYGNE